MIKVIKHRRQYHLNKDGLYVTIRQKAIFLFIDAYSRDHVAKILYTEIRYDIDAMNIFVYGADKQLSAKINDVKEIWDMR